MRCDELGEFTGADVALAWGAAPGCVGMLPVADVSFLHGG